MISKGTLVIVAEVLGDMKFSAHCNLLNKNLEECLRKSFKDERISQARIDRIVKKFTDRIIRNED